MRLFVAVEPSAAVKDAAARAAQSLRDTLPASGTKSFRWVPAENLHLTVWFLGEVADHRAPAILEALAVPLKQPQFELGISGLGLFPPTGAPRVVWMGVPDGAAALREVHEEIGRRLQALGFPKERRPYSAHLTLARIKEPPPPPIRRVLREAIAASSAEAGSCLARSATVFRSRTSPAGARYEPVLRVPLS